MDAAFNRFVCLLKRNGVRISPSETIDAMQALLQVGVGERETVKTALRSTLIKDMHDIGVFDELFEVFFGLPTRRRDTTHDHHHHHDGAPAEPERIVFDEEERGVNATDGEHAHGDPVPIRDYFEPEMMVTRFNPHQDPNQLSLTAMSQGLLLNRNKGLLDQVMKQVTHQINVRRVGNVGKPGDLTFGDAFLQLDEDLIVNAVHALLDDLRDLDVDEAVVNAMAQRIDGIIANLPELLKRYLEREMALQKVQDPHQEPVASAYDYRFGESERREMREIVRRLGRRMRGASSYHQVVSRRGRIHVPRTLRRSMVYDGIPFDPVLTSRRNERPRIVVLCDVSLSVRHTARFMLHLVYSLQSLFEAVRSFVFVSDLAEASASFEQLGIDEAIASIFEGGLIDCDTNSDYGRALSQFAQKHLSAVTNETTVIVLGDGRGNRNPPNVAALEEIRRRAKQLVWLSPEPRGSWGLGSSDMPLYEPVCHRTEVVRNLAQLGEVADGLFRRSVAARAGHSGAGHAGGGHG